MLRYLFAVLALGVCNATPPDTKVCFCPNWRYSNFNCSAACCDLPPTPGHSKPYVCEAPPQPNPATMMASVTVDGAVEMGAVTPRGEAPTIEFNNTGSKGWVIHMSGGGWGFRKNTSAASLRFKRDGILTPPATRPAAATPYKGVWDSPPPPPPPPPACYLKCDGIMSADAAQNPLFHEYVTKSLHPLLFFLVSSRGH